jgi:hypothetical protein
MRDLMTLENLVKSALLAAVLTVMSVGRLVQAGVPEAAWLFGLPMLVAGVIGCVLFAHFGLVPAMLFAASLHLRLFLPG